MEMTGLAPKESRTYQITEWQRKIAKVFTFQYDDKATHALTVTLEPCATVRGRLLDEEGGPLKDVEVWASAERNGKDWFSLYTMGLVTDADGHFAIENLAAGCDTYQIEALALNEFVTVAQKVTYAPGKTIDLGDIKIKRDGTKAVSSSEPKMPTPALRHRRRTRSNRKPHPPRPQRALSPRTKRRGSFAAPCCGPMGSRPLGPRFLCCAGPGPTGEVGRHGPGRRATLRFASRVRRTTFPAADPCGLPRGPTDLTSCGFAGAQSSRQWRRIRSCSGSFRNRPSMVAWLTWKAGR